MQKYLSKSAPIVIALLIIMTIPAQAALTSIMASVNEAKIKVNGKNVDAGTINYNGRVYIPVNAVGTVLGKDVSWDAASKTVLINDKGVASDPKPTPSDPKTTGSSKLIAKYEGTNDIISENFTITSKKWKVVYTTTKKDDTSNFIMVLSTDTDSIKTVNTSDNSSNTVIMDGAGTYHITINSSQPFKVEIFEQ